MAYEGKYLRAQAKSSMPAAKAEKKKGRVRPWMIVVAVILVLVIAIGAFGFSYYKSMLGNVKRAEYEEKNQDLSYEDLLAQIGGGSGGGNSAQETEAEVIQEEK